MKNPFPIERKADKQYRQNLSRWRQMAEAIGDRAGLAVLKSQPKEVIALTGPRIEKAFATKMRNSGQLFPEETVDATGRDCTVYHGDIRSAFEPFLIPATPIKIAETVWHRGLPYIKDQLPAWVQAERALAQIGTRPERGAPVGSGD